MANLYLSVKGQTLTVKSDIDRIVENSINYLKINIDTSQDSEWSDPNLNIKCILSNKEKSSAFYENNYVTKDFLKAPGFVAHLIGYSLNEDGETYKKVIPTNPVIVTIYPTGVLNAKDEPEEEIESGWADKVIQSFNDKISEEIDKKLENKTISLEHISNKTFSVNDFSTDQQYPSAKAVNLAINEKFEGRKSLNSLNFINKSFSIGTGLIENNYALALNTAIFVNKGDQITINPKGFSVWLATVDNSLIDANTRFVESLPWKKETFSHTFTREGWLYLQIVKEDANGKWSSIFPSDYQSEIVILLQNETVLEMTDLRRGIDGTTYESAGDAVRSQISNSEGLKILLASDFINGQFKQGIGIEEYDLWLITQKSIPVNRGDKINISPNGLRVWVLLQNNEDPSLVTKNSSLYLGVDKKNIEIEEDGWLCIQVGQSGENQGKPIAIVDYNCDITIGKSLKEKIETDINDLKKLKKDIAQSVSRKSINGNFIIIEDGVKFTQPLSCKISGIEIPSNKFLRVSGKNLLSFPYYERKKTVNGVTFISNEDGTISTSGVATDGNAIMILNYNSNIPIPKDASITISGSPVGANYTTYTVSAETELQDGSALYLFDINGRNTSSLIKTIKTVSIAIYEGTNADNLVFKPQIEIGSTQTEYESPHTIDIVDIETEEIAFPSKNPTTVILSSDDDIIINCEYATIFNLSMEKISETFKFDDNIGNRLPANIAFDLNDFQEGYLSTNGITVYPGENYKHSGFIEVQDRREISLKNAATLGLSKVFFYDEDYHLIGRVEGPVYSPINPETIFVTPFNTKYIRFGISASQLENISISYVKEDYKDYWINDLVKGWYNSGYKKIGKLFGDSVKQPLITIIDDDTTSLVAVQRFHDYCVNNRIVGTYATLTDFLNRTEGLAEQLLEYEKEGFHVCFHGWKQSPFYTMNGYESAGAENDFVTGYQDMTKYGFSDWKFWCTPYGQSFQAIQNLARKWGMKCLVRSTSAHEPGLIETTEAKNGKWALYRVGMHSHDDGTAVPTLEELKVLVDETVEKGGWLLINTHMQYNGTNEGTEEDWTTDEAKVRFADFVNYAKNAGCVFTTLNEAWRIKEPIYNFYDFFN